MKEDPSTFLYLGSMLHNTGRLDDAQRAFKQGLNLDPHRTDLLCSLVCVLCVYCVACVVCVLLCSVCVLCSMCLCCHHNPITTGTGVSPRRKCGRSQNSAGRSHISTPLLRLSQSCHWHVVLQAKPVEPG